METFPPGQSRTLLQLRVGAFVLVAIAIFAGLVYFLGRQSGPRAGWLLASLDRPFVVERLRAAGGAA